MNFKRAAALHLRLKRIAGKLQRQMMDAEAQEQVAWAARSHLVDELTLELQDVGPPVPTHAPAEQVAPPPLPLFSALRFNRAADALSAPCALPPPPPHAPTAPWARTRQQHRSLRACPAQKPHTCYVTIVSYMALASIGLGRGGRDGGQGENEQARAVLEAANATVAAAQLGLADGDAQRRASAPLFHELEYLDHDYALYHMNQQRWARSRTRTCLCRGARVWPPGWARRGSAARRTCCAAGSNGGVRAALPIMGARPRPQRERSGGGRQLCAEGLRVGTLGRRSHHLRLLPWRLTQQPASSGRSSRRRRLRLPGAGATGFGKTSLGRLGAGPPPPAPLATQAADMDMPHQAA